MHAQTASDGQWRFPALQNFEEKVPEKFAQAIIVFEDRHFYRHPGFNPGSLLKAALRNYKAGRVVSGGSTLSMQVIRMWRNKERTWKEKCIEVLYSMRLEMRYKKREILALYASYAPFGGNVVGLDAASWRYFGKDASHLTWAEAATLAVLPNSPSLIHPGKNRALLMEKRNRLLNRLLQRGVINEFEWSLSLLEPIPEKPLPMPGYAYHLHGKPKFSGQKVTTNIILSLQKEVERVLNMHHGHLSSSGIHNAAVLVVDNRTGNVLSYAGNIPVTREENDVDMITAERSSGSILKPFLYAAAMEEGLISPNQLLADVPINIDGFRPSNFKKDFTGAIPASDALAKSLNIPFVLLLQEFGIEKFLRLLRQTGFSSLRYTSDHYGLSLILGGGEVTLWDLCHAYMSMAGVLNSYNSKEGAKTIRLLQDEHSRSPLNIPFQPGTIYHVFQAMTRLYRPGIEGYWEQFSSSRKIAWKTGTSYGHRDAWAVGIDPRYTIGVWVGNADGEGHPDLSGTLTSGQILFDIFNLLPQSAEWFLPPHDNMVDAVICKNSGHLAGSHCAEPQMDVLPKNTIHSTPCPYHQKIFMDSESHLRGFAHCHPTAKDTSWFVLPVRMAYYYKRHHADYEDIPPLHPACEQEGHQNEITLIYPQPFTEIGLTTGLNHENKSTVFKAAHLREKSTLFWHLNDEYLGSTTGIHEMKIRTDPGKHKIILVDESGNTLQRFFTIL